KAYAGRGADARQRACLARLRRGAMRLAAHDTDPARRAARPPAAHRHVWNVVTPARFENGPSSRDLHDAVRICNRDQKVAAALDERPDLPRREYQRDGREVEGED